MPVTEVIQPTDEVEEVVPAEVVEPVENDTPDDGAVDTAADTVVVTIGDQEVEEDEDSKKPKFIQLRDAHRDALKREKELQRQLAAIQGAKGPEALGPKPTLEGVDYDTARFEAETDAWYAKKAEFDAAKRKEDDAKAAEDAAWQKKLNGYGTAKTEFKARAPDFDEAEVEVQNAFSPTQQGIIVKGSKNAAVLIYALGKNTDKLKELAAIQDPVEFAFAVATLETQLKVSNRQAPPPPEARARGQVAAGNTSDQKLASLRAAAEKSGDYTEVLKYKRSLKQKQA